MEHHKRKQPRCKHCGQFYSYNKRGRKREHCGQAKCKNKAKKDSQQKWVENNPGYFNGRYENTKKWREDHPNYQREWRSQKGAEIQEKKGNENQLQELHLVLPGKIFKGEIQEKIILFRHCGCGYWISGQEREIQEKID